MSNTDPQGGRDSKLDMYRREHTAFRAATFRPGLCDDLWSEIDRLTEQRP